MIPSPSGNLSSPIFLLLLMMAVGMLAAACAASPADGPNLAETPNRDEGERNSSSDQQRNGKPTQISEVTVGPARVECYGPFRRMCLVVDGGLFYDGIDGFTHEPGYTYRLRIERYDAFPGRAEPPQDTGRYSYRLVEVISKTRTSGAVSQASVSPARANCPKSDELCMLLDGQPVRGAISGFDYEAGYDYRIRFERFDNGSRRLIDVISKVAAPGTQEEITVGLWRVKCYEDDLITAACIVVNGEPFFGQIENFPRVHGYEYHLRVEKYDLMPAETVPPPETSKYGYRLSKVLSEMPANQPPRPIKLTGSPRTQPAQSLFQGYPR